MGVDTGIIVSINDCIREHTDQEVHIAKMRLSFPSFVFLLSSLTIVSTRVSIDRSEVLDDVDLREVDTVNVLVHYSMLYFMKFVCMS